MSAVPVRCPGYHPETEIHCDASGGCARNAMPPSDWNSEDARRMARLHGWVRVEFHDYCPEHRPVGS